MDAPTKEDFKQWRQVAERDLAASLYASLSEIARTGTPGEYREAFIRAYLETRGALWQELGAQMERTSVGRWMKENRLLLDAKAKALKKRRGSVELSVQEQAERAADEITNSSSGDPEVWRLLADARAKLRLETSFAHTYHYHMALAIDSYLNEDADAILTAARTFLKTAKQHLENIRSLETLDAQLSELTEKQPMTFAAGNVKRLEQRIDFWEGFSRIISLEPSTNTRRAEQLFVYRMARLNRRAVGEQKPESIYLLLLSLPRKDGKVPISESTVARYCEKMTEVRAQRAMERGLSNIEKRPKERDPRPIGAKSEPPQALNA